MFFCWHPPPSGGLFPLFVTFFDSEASLSGWWWPFLGDGRKGPNLTGQIKGTYLFSCDSSSRSPPVLMNVGPHVCPSVCNTFATLQHCTIKTSNITTLQYYNIVTLQQCNISTWQHCNIATMQHFNFETLRLCNFTSLQVYNTATLKYCNIATL